MEIPDYVYPAIIGAIAAVVTNILFFEYRFHKEKQRDFLKRQIEELLLPLYIKMHEYDCEMDYNDMQEGTQTLGTIVRNDKDIKKIAIEKLNLATPKLSKLLLEFMRYRFFDFDHNILWDGVDDDVVGELRQEVINEYEQKRKEYQYMNPWWQFWR
jgi:hypothetical protein